jgi:mannan endo-1,4-beta-mannosidase
LRCGLALCLSLWLVECAPATHPEGTVASAPRAPQQHTFVTRLGRCLLRDGARFRVVGSSAMFLQEDAARELAGQRGSRGRMMSGFDAAERAGVQALRIAAFNDGPRDEVAAIQVERGAYSETGLRGLDWVVAEAGRRGMVLILVLSNYWADYGGLAQYLRWRGYREGDRWRAFEDPQLFADLRDYAVTIARRVNTFTGVRYADDPTIMAWEVMNEPRGEGLTDDGEIHARFLIEMARALHGVAPRQLVVAGDEGLDFDVRGYDAAYWSSRVEASVVGARVHQSYRRVVSSPEIDAGTLHFYPEVWGVRLGDEGESGVRWVREHAAIADEQHKPLLFEEFGLGDPRRRGPRLPLDVRRAAYERWFEASRLAPNVAAVMPWGLTYPGHGPPDGYAWGQRDGDDDDYAPLVRRWRDVLARDRDRGGCE